MEPSCSFYVGHIRDPSFLEQIAGQRNLGVLLVGGGGSLMDSNPTEPEPTAT